MSATKYDSGKVDLTLIPPKAVNAMCQALEYGVRKYGRDNYKQKPHLGEARLLGGCLGHILAHLGGEARDKESGLPHLYHALAGLAMLLENTCTESVRERISNETSSS